MALDDDVVRARIWNAAIAISAGASVSAVISMAPWMAIVTVGGDGSLPGPIRFILEFVEGLQSALGVSYGAARLICGVFVGAITYLILQQIWRPRDFRIYKNARKSLGSPLSVETYCAKYGMSASEVSRYIEEGQLRAYRAGEHHLVEDAAPLRLRRPGREAVQYLVKPVHVVNYCENYGVTEAQVQRWISEGRVRAYEDANGLFVADSPPPPN